MGLAEAKRLIGRLSAPEAGAHAVLFYGVKGSGKEELAAILAGLWLCRNPDPEMGADETCQACGAYERKNNPDFLEISPRGPTGIIKIFQVIPPVPEVEQPVLPLSVFYRTKPLMSAHKVAVLHDVHKTSDAAANSLLKMLEEPWAHARLILTTDSIGGVRPTVLSRCLAVCCSLPAKNEVAEAFPEATAQQVELAEGAPGRLAAILKHPIPYRRLADFTDSLKSRPWREAIAAAEELRKISESLEKALDCGARAANSECLAILATRLARDPETPPGWAQRAAEAHRRVVGNGQMALISDALLTEILARR